VVIGEYSRLSAVLVKEPRVVFAWPSLGVAVTVQGFVGNSLKALKDKEK
jgi:hypothetical protein